MPWCPQCGAEYRAGYTRCAKCGVALQAARPNLPQPERQITIPSFLQRPWRDMQRAWGYGVEAARVLRRCPVLLLVPFAVAVADTGERTLGVHMTRDWVARQLETRRVALEIGRLSTKVPWSQRLATAARTSFTAQTAASILASPIPEISFDGAGQVVASVVWQLPEQRSVTLAVLMRLVLSLIIVLPLASAIDAGYYRLAKTPLDGESPAWGSFGPGVRAYFLRFILFGVLVLGISMAGMVGFFLMPQVEMTESLFTLLRAAERAWAYLMLLPLVILGLTRVAVVSDEKGLRAGMRASIRVVLRDPGIAVLLLVAAFAVVGILVFPVNLASTFVWDYLRPIALVQSSAVFLARNTTAAVFGTWFLLISFLWYRDASARFAQQSFDTSPAPPLESA